MKLLKAIYAVFEDMGRARAAGVMARSGNYKGATALMSQKSA